MKYNFKEEVLYFVNCSLSRELSGFIFLGGFFHLSPLDGVWIMQIPQISWEELAQSKKKKNSAEKDKCGIWTQVKIVTPDTVAF